MKSFLVFLSGFICGVIFLIMLACIFVNLNSPATDTDADNGITIGHPLSRPLDHSDTDNGITMLEHDGERYCRIRMSAPQGRLTCFAG